MKNILDLGGPGFGGRHVIKKLVKQGYTVTVELVPIAVDYLQCGLPGNGLSGLRRRI